MPPEHVSVRAEGIGEDKVVSIVPQRGLVETYQNDTNPGVAITDYELPLQYTPSAAELTTELPAQYEFPILEEDSGLLPKPCHDNPIPERQPGSFVIDIKM